MNRNEPNARKKNGDTLAFLHMARTAASKVQYVPISVSRGERCHVARLPHLLFFAHPRTRVAPLLGITLVELFPVAFHHFVLVN
jgi:hypothetical protein